MRLKKCEGIPIDKNLDLVFLMANVIFSLSPVLLDWISVDSFKKLKELLQKKGQHSISSCFKFHPRIEEYECYIEFPCERCESVGYVQKNKYDFINMLEGKESMVCSGCLNDKNTEDYIDHYLNVSYVWPKNIAFETKWTEICILRTMNIDLYSIILLMRSMDYKEFLKTPYWKVVSEKKKIEAEYRCQLCNREKNLHTHHRTYENLGDELKNMNDLTVLCSKCHSKHHDKN